MKAVINKGEVVIQNFENRDEEEMFQIVVQGMRNHFSFVKMIQGPSEDVALFKYGEIEFSIGYDLDYGLNNIKVDDMVCAEKILSVINSID